MKISYRTKIESNNSQEIEFLKLTGSERVFQFFQLSRKMMRYPTQAKQINDNYILSLEDARSMEK